MSLARCRCRRHHRYIFEEKSAKAAAAAAEKARAAAAKQQGEAPPPPLPVGARLQELGPRFTLKLQSLQKGTFDSKFGEYEWVHKKEMDTSRRRFHL